jgi:hypothetical protein
MNRSGNTRDLPIDREEVSRSFVGFEAILSVGREAADTPALKSNRPGPTMPGRQLTLVAGAGCHLCKTKCILGKRSFQITADAAESCRMAAATMSWVRAKRRD